MYKIYNFNISPKSILVVGDLHGYWGLLKYKIKESGMQNSIVIVAGDCGFGFEKPEYYKQQYNKIVRTLSKQNVTLLFVRGNHDDPEYFNGNLNIDYKYFKTIPDYSVLIFKETDSDESYNVLCIGGAISVDRVDRVYNDFMSNKSSYWKNEYPVYMPDIIDEISKEILIDSVITHTSPDFAPLSDKSGISHFIELDDKLIDDVNNERSVMTNIYNHLIKNNHPIKNWFYGHFHQHNNIELNGVRFIMLDKVHTRNNSWDICPLKR